MSEFSSIAREVKAHKSELSKEQKKPSSTELKDPVSSGSKPEYSVNNDLNEVVANQQFSSSSEQVNPETSETALKQSILGSENLKDLDQIFVQLEIKDPPQHESENSTETKGENLSDVVSETNLESSNQITNSDSSTKKVCFASDCFESKKITSNDEKPEETSANDKKPIQTTFKPRKKKGN